MMRLALHTLICCCVIAAVLPVPVEDTGDASLKKRIRAWLQNLEVTAGDRHPEVQQGEEEETTSPPPSSGLNLRSRRAARLKAPGCFLFMCAYHNLLYSLEHFSSKQKVEKAPEDRMRPSGYGRRRRRSLGDGSEAALRTDQRDSEDAPPVCRHNICAVA